MNKLGLLLGLTFFSIFGTHAQINMSIQVPPVGVLQRSQLWNITALYAGQVPVNTMLKLTLLSGTDNRPLLIGTSRVVTLRKGANQFSSHDFEPINYNAVAPVFAYDRTLNGLIPIGSYLACYSLVTVETEVPVLLAEECIPLEVMPLSPPMLNTPFNGSEIETKHPLFTWIPPTPINSFGELVYDFLLVEVMPGQAAEQAIQRNTPLLVSGSVRGIYKNYPSTGVSLDTGRWYAWKIVARNNGAPVGESEVWTFKVKSETRNGVDNVKEPFVRLKRGYESSYTICKGGELKFQYMNEANDTTVFYSIVGEGTDRVEKEGYLRCNYGQNLFTISLDKDRNIKAGKTYQLKLVNSRKEYWNVRFLVQHNVSTVD